MNNRTQLAIGWLAITLATILPATPALAAAPPAIPGDRPAYESLISVDLRDVAQFERGRFPEAATLVTSIQKNPTLFFPRGTTHVYGIELTQDPGILPDTVPVTALVATTHGYFFRKMDVALDPVTREATGAAVREDIPLSSARFSVRVGLVDRKMIVEDPLLGIRMIYPLGVGGFDEGITALSHGRTRLMTPLFAGATIDRRTANPARSWPAYYRGLPFMPITRADGKLTDIAFHILQTPQMVRGFLSHGCMRMREKDLLELFTLLFHGGTPSIPVEVTLNLPSSGPDRDDHPFPLRDGDYEHVVNCAKPGRPPRTCSDPKYPDLTDMSVVAGAPPVAALDPYNGDSFNASDLKMLGADGDAAAAPDSLP